ncbi:hypothetical protein [Massilia pseudoviolaceinigra]|uniref:hypothetical protein n=1 Tax=Massilia pseudoviolaceinigra TaxID=3057165 RepID=UPI002796563F|nr:hypothetical protein [Massilia sp. CCM 9206]MDQ1924559.1 hypothetical protein [Massilia sp. CCM 9206]
MTTKTTTISLKVHKAWWLMPYLRALALFHALTRTEPNWARIKRLINKGVTVRAVSAERQWLPTARDAALLLAAVALNALSASASIASPGHAWVLGLCAGMTYGYVVRPWVGAFIKARCG